MKGQCTWQNTSRCQAAQLEAQLVSVAVWTGNLVPNEKKEKKEKLKRNL